jgi:hypothetical protein
VQSVRKTDGGKQFYGDKKIPPSLSDNVFFTHMPINQTNFAELKSSLGNRRSRLHGVPPAPHNYRVVKHFDLNKYLNKFEPPILQLMLTMVSMMHPPIDRALQPLQWENCFTWKSS